MSEAPVQPQIFARRLIALYGGHEAARHALYRSFDEMAQRWNQDALLIGRILRSHLFVEYYLTRYLAVRNPALGELDSARLSFAQKVSLADRSDASVSYLIPGVAQLNKIRNRLAHTLRADVSEEDSAVFLGIDMFRALRDALAEPGTPSLAPIDVLEDFARHAGIAFGSASSPERQLWAKALSAVEENDGA